MDLYIYKLILYGLIYLRVTSEGDGVCHFHYDCRPSKLLYYNVDILLGIYFKLEVTTGLCQSP